jgi:competence protein ComEA
MAVHRDDLSSVPAWSSPQLEPTTLSGSESGRASFREELGLFAPSFVLRIGALLLLIASAGFLAGLTVAGSPQPQVNVVSAAEGTGAGDDGSAPRQGSDLVVHVAGAVRHPGLYRLPSGSRVGDAIAAAGGYAPAVDPAAVDAALNLAALLHDGDQLVVPAREVTSVPRPVSSAPRGAARESAAAGLVDLNTATEAQLEALPGIGPVTAAKILASRAETPFRSVDDLRARKLVGPTTMEKIRPLVVVR